MSRSRGSKPRAHLRANTAFCAPLKQSRIKRFPLVEHGFQTEALDHALSRPFAHRAAALRSACCIRLVICAAQSRRHRLLAASKPVSPCTITSRVRLHRLQRPATASACLQQHHGQPFIARGEDESIRCLHPLLDIRFEPKKRTRRSRPSRAASSRNSLSSGPLPKTRSRALLGQSAP